MDASGIPRRKPLVLAITIAAFVIVIICIIVLIITLLDYKKIRDAETVTPGKAGVMYWFTAFTLALFVFLLAYMAWKVYREFFPEHLTMLKYQAANYLTDGQPMPPMKSRVEAMEMNEFPSTRLRNVALTRSDTIKSRGVDL